MLFLWKIILFMHSDELQHGGGTERSAMRTRRIEPSLWHPDRALDMAITRLFAQQTPPLDNWDAWYEVRMEEEPVLFAAHPGIRKFQSLVGDGHAILSTLDPINQEADLKQYSFVRTHNMGRDTDPVLSAVVAKRHPPHANSDKIRAERESVLLGLGFTPDQVQLLAMHSVTTALSVADILKGYLVNGLLDPNASNSDTSVSTSVQVASNDPNLIGENGSTQVFRA